VVEFEEYVWATWGGPVVTALRGLVCVEIMIVVFALVAAHLPRSIR
jgi:hypothetical protein